MAGRLSSWVIRDSGATPDLQQSRWVGVGDVPPVLTSLSCQAGRQDSVEPHGPLSQLSPPAPKTFTAEETNQLQMVLLQTLLPGDHTASHVHIKLVIDPVLVAAPSAGRRCQMEPVQLDACIDFCMLSFTRGLLRFSFYLWEKK